MEVAQQQSGSPSEPEQIPGVPSDAPQAVIDASQGEKEKLTGSGERDALAWLLGPTKRLEHDVRVQFETPDGMVPLVFHIIQLDGRRLDQLDEEHRSQGEGPFAKLDTLAFNAHVVSEATAYITGIVGGRRVAPKSEEFMAGVQSPALAMELRFKYQPGILEGVVTEIRKLAAYSPDRVGGAQRSLVAAVGNSSS